MVFDALLIATFLLVSSVGSGVRGRQPQKIKMTGRVSGMTATGTEPRQRVWRNIHAVAALQR